MSVLLLICSPALSRHVYVDSGTPVFVLLRIAPMP